MSVSHRKKTDRQNNHNMSRFFAAGYTSDALSSEEEDLLSSSEEELQLSSQEELLTDSEFENDSDEESSEDEDYLGAGPLYFLKKDFLNSGQADLDLDSEDERKVVKSAKEKLLDDILELVDLIYNLHNVENWAAVLTEFDRLGRTLTKAQQQNVAVPNLFFRILGALDKSVLGEKDKKKLPADQNRAFNTMKQRMKKAAKEWQPYLDLYHENAAAFDQEEPVVLALAQVELTPAPQAQAARLMLPVFTTLKTISELRGKKNIDKAEQVAVLESLLEDVLPTQKLFEIITVYQMLLSVRFDALLNQLYMPIDLWKQNEKDLTDFLLLLEKLVGQYWVSELGVPTDDIDLEPPANENGVKVILGSVAALVERLDDEFTRSLQNADPHSIEYIERLKDEAGLYALIVRAQVYVELTTSVSEHLARIALRRLDHVYFKPDQLIAQNEELAWQNVWPGLGLEKSVLVTKDQQPAQIVAALLGFLAEQDNDIYKHQAVLRKTYYNAVNAKYAEARELFLDSQLYNIVGSVDSSTQVLYNRALVQLGLSAFRAGHIEELHQILNEILNSQRLKELLGQGYNSKFPSQVTSAERQKLLPFHMHINLELLECVFMTLSLLIEIPALAVAGTTKDSRRKASIKLFKAKLEFHDRQYFTGPPELIKDHLIYASKYLQRGDWAKAYKLLLLIKIWRLFPDSDAMLLMLKNQLQVEGLRTFIATYKSIYTNVSLAKLAQQFQLDLQEVHQILDRMIQAGDVRGSLSEKPGFVNFASDGPQRSKLQELAIVMNDKKGLLKDKNEKTSSNGHGKKQALQQQQQQQKEQKEQKEFLYEENSRFRYANVNTNNDEFQVTA